LSLRRSQPRGGGTRPGDADLRVLALHRVIIEAPPSGLYGDGRERAGPGPTPRHEVDYGIRCAEGVIRAVCPLIEESVVQVIPSNDMQDSSVFSELSATNVITN
jgi:hypothetical protein